MDVFLLFPSLLGSTEESFLHKLAFFDLVKNVCFIAFLAYQFAISLDGFIPGGGRIETSIQGVFKLPKG